MSVRTDNQAIIAEFLREKHVKREDMIKQINQLPPEQRAAVTRQEKLNDNLIDTFTVREINDRLGSLEYHNIRYALVGPNDKAIKERLQPYDLAIAGIRVVYTEGKRLPKFTYDPDMRYQALTTGKVVAKPAPNSGDAIRVVSEVKPEPSNVVDEASPESNERPVEVEPCNFKHIPRWAMEIHKHELNGSKIKVNSDTNALEIDGSEIIAMQWITREMAKAMGYSDDTIANSKAILNDASLVIDEPSPE